MNKIVKLFLLCLTIVFITSLQVSQINLPEIFQGKPLIDENEISTCLSSAIPENAQVLFFTKSDGTTDTNLYGEAFGLALYQLVPRVISAIRFAPVKIEEFSWFIAYKLPAAELKVVMDQIPMEIIQSCDQYAVLKKIP